MKMRWMVFALPLAIALLAIGNPALSWADITDNGSNSADDMSLAAQGNLNYNDVAAGNSFIVEDNLNGPIGNDTQVAKQAANEQSVVVDDIEVKDTANYNETEVKYNDTQVAKQAANDQSVVVDDIEVEDVANDKSTNVKYNDTQVAEQAANDNSVVIGDITDVGNVDNSLNIGDIDVKVAASVLSGSVTGNYISTLDSLYGSEIEITTGDNCFGSGDSFTSNGIFVNSQNTGIMSQTQQSISVQANVINSASVE